MTSRAIKQFHLDPALRLDQSRILSLLLRAPIFYQAWAFHKVCPQPQGPGSGARGCDRPSCQLPCGYPAAQYLHWEDLSSPPLGRGPAPYTLPRISPLCRFLRSRLRTSFKLDRSKRLLPFMSKSPVVLQRAVARCFEAIHIHLLVSLYGAET